MNAKVIRELEAIVGKDGIRLGDAQRVAYSYDGTFQQRLPDAAILPETTEQVSRILTVANREHIPVVTRGAGTSLSGGAIPATSGIVLDLARMNRILEVDTDNAVVVAQAGVITGDLHHAVEAQGLFYPPDPASLQQCTIGGNVACNSGGPRCLKYGVTKDYVLGMTVVLADGRVLELGGKLVKNVTGYQLMQLIVGSEGTLGVVTQVTLRLIPFPRMRQTARAAFRSLDDASRAVSAIIAAGVLPVALEMLDKTTLDVVSQYRGIDFPEGTNAVLIMEQDGYDTEAISLELHEIVNICKHLGAIQIDEARDEAERQALWETRRAASGALGRAAPNKLGEDIAVPRARIPDMVRRIQQISDEHGFTIAVFGHAGDGNLHPNILFDKNRPGEMERLEGAAAAIFQAALDLGGTLSGEHGIGTLKREFLERDLGSDAVSVMRLIKTAFDPNGILNPDKVFPKMNGAADMSGFLTALPVLGQSAAL